MLLDEGVKDSVPLDPLPAEVEERRLDLADPTGIQLPAWKATHAQRYGQPHATSRPRPRFLPDRVSNLDETNVGAGRLKVFLWWKPFIKYIIPIAVAVILFGGILKAVGR